MSNSKNVLEGIAELVEEFNDIRSNYSDYINYGDIQNSSLQLYREKFTKVQADMIPYLSTITGMKISRDDRSCRRKLSSLTIQLEGIKGSDGKPYSFRKAETVAPSCDEYNEFMEERQLYYEAYTTISSMYSSCQNYIHAVASRLN